MVVSPWPLIIKLTAGFKGPEIVRGGFAGSAMGNSEHGPLPTATDDSRRDSRFK